MWEANSLNWPTPPRQNLGRLNPDGSLDAAFAAGTDGPVKTLALQSDGRIVAGGAFTTLGGQPRSRLGRLLPDGTVDPDFHPEVDPAEKMAVRVLAIQPDGKIVVGGEFFQIDGKPRTNLARVNPDGSLDPELDIMVDGPVGALQPRADGKILVGGGFLTFGMQASVGLGCLNPDGSVDDSYSGWAEFMVFGLLQQPDGKTLVGGFLITLGGQERNGLGRLAATAPPVEQLTYDGSTLTWRRDGPGPEVARTTFAYSLEGDEWTPLGEGSRISGGWELTGVSLPEGARVWARGWTPRSGWAVNAWISPPFLLSEPVPQTVDFGAPARFQVAAGGGAPPDLAMVSRGGTVDRQRRLRRRQDPDIDDSVGVGRPSWRVPRGRPQRARQRGQHARFADRE